MLKAAAHIDFLFPLRAFTVKALLSAGFGCHSAGMSVSGKPDEQEGRLFSKMTKDVTLLEKKSMSERQ